MNKFITLTTTIATLAFSNILAAPVNITVYDELPPMNEGVGVGYEDQEIDAGYFEQRQDLEAIFWDGYSLSIVAGFDFKDGFYYQQFGGEDAIHNHIVSGDVFIDLGRNNSYDLVIDFDVEGLTYTVYEYSDANVVDVFSGWNHDFANPLEINGGVQVGTGVLEYNNYDTDVYGLNGGYHNEVIFTGLAAHGITGNFGVHYTISCGNDVILGSVPEPAILTLLGLGIFGVAFFRRKRS
jgi:hypothetical protein